MFDIDPPAPILERRRELVFPFVEAVLLAHLAKQGYPCKTLLLEFRGKFGGFHDTGSKFEGLVDVTQPGRQCSG